MEYSSHMAEEFLQMRNELILMDFRVKLKNKFLLPCHRLILAANSPVLKAMLTSNMVEASQQKVELDHIDVDTMQILLDYMYSGNVKFHKDQLMDIISACDYLQMTELKQMCVDQVPVILEPANVILWLELAMTLDFPKIQDPCIEIMTSSLDNLSQQENYLSANETRVQNYLRLVDDSADCNEVLEAAMRWVSHDSHSRCIHVMSFLNQINLDRCTMDGILNIIGTYGHIFETNASAYKMLTCAMIKVRKPTDECPAQNLVILGNQPGEDEIYRVCMKLNSSNQFEDVEGILVSYDGILKSGQSVCQIPMGIAVTGGRHSNMCKIFVASLKSWCYKPNMRIQRMDHASICVKNMIQVFGGCQSAAKKTVDYLPIKGKNWLSGPDLPIPMLRPKVSNIEENVYLLDDFSKALLKLDMKQKKWISCASLPEGKRVSLVSARGLLFAVGIGIFAWYIPGTDTWCMGNRPLHNHLNGALTFYQNKLLLLGGRFTEDIEEYDITNNTWSMCSYKMPLILEDHFALILDC